MTTPSLAVALESHGLLPALPPPPPPDTFDHFPISERLNTGPCGPQAKCVWPNYAKKSSRNSVKIKQLERWLIKQLTNSVSRLDKINLHLGLGKAKFYFVQAVLA